MKYLIVKAKGGMGNRMLCAVTGVLYGQLSGRQTYIDWSDGAYSDDGSNSFSKFFSCDGIYSGNDFPKPSSVSPVVWQMNLLKSMSEMLHQYDPEKHSSIRIHRKYSIDISRLDYEDEVVVFWYYIDRLKSLRKHLRKRDSGFCGLDDYGVIRKVLKEQMVLEESIQKRINDFKKEHWADQVIGVHIRYTDRKTNLAKYEKHLRKLLKRYPDAHIFLATDNKLVAQEYETKFENIFSTPKWYPEGSGSMHQNEDCGNKVSNGIEALVDMYLLAECDGLIYSGYSTFSVISRILSNAKPSNIIDIDRFNIKVQLKKMIRELVS